MNYAQRFKATITPLVEPRSPLRQFWEALNEYIYK